MLRIGRYWLVFLLSAWWWAIATADTVAFQNEGQARKIDGNVLFHDRFGTILLEGRDLQHYVIRSNEIESHIKSAKPAPPYSRQELRKTLEKEFGGAFRFHASTNYLVVYSCEPAFAAEAAKLFERSYVVFCNYFRNKGGFRLDKPRQPMVAVICATQKEYLNLVGSKLGAIAGQTAGVYVHGSNRMYLYDAFGGKSAEFLKAKAEGKAINGAALSMLERNVSVLVHESVHQMAYNTGFHQRNVHHPLWLVEGMALYFEAPDPAAKDGWKGAGNLNQAQLAQLSKLFPRLEKGSLTRLILDDSVLREPATALDSYSLAWAMTYYLARAKTQSYVRYLRIVNARKPLEPYAQEDRMQDFRTAFGKPPDDLELDFRRYFSRLVQPQNAETAAAQN